MNEQGLSLTQAEKQKLEAVNKELESKIARWVSGLVVPIALPLSTVISFYVQKWLKFHLDAGSLAAYLGTIAAGASVSAYKWVDNRGAYERGLLDIVKLHELGQAEAPNSPPTGLSVGNS